jgi:hypothetical protein
MLMAMFKSCHVFSEPRLRFLFLLFSFCLSMAILSSSSCHIPIYLAWQHCPGGAQHSTAQSRAAQRFDGIELVEYIPRLCTGVVQ